MLMKREISEKKVGRTLGKQERQSRVILKKERKERSTVGGGGQNRTGELSHSEGRDRKTPTSTAVNIAVTRLHTLTQSYSCLQTQESTLTLHTHFQTDTQDLIKSDNNKEETGRAAMGWEHGDSH